MVLQDFKKMVVPPDPKRYRYITGKLKPYLKTDLCVPKPLLGIPGTWHTFMDLIPWDVTYNLEVRPALIPHNNLPPTTDSIEMDIFPNIRRNGGRLFNSYRLIDTQETHAFPKFQGTSSGWVADMIRAIEQGKPVRRRTSTQLQ